MKQAGERGAAGGLRTPLPQFLGAPKKSSRNRVNVLAEVTAPSSEKIGYIKKPSWNSFIINRFIFYLIEIKPPKNTTLIQVIIQKLIFTPSVEVCTKMRREWVESTIKLMTPQISSLKKLNTTSMSGKLWWVVMSTCTWEGAFLNITFEE